MKEDSQGSEFQPLVFSTRLVYNCTALCPTDPDGGKISGFLLLLRLPESCSRALHCLHTVVQVRLAGRAALCGEDIRRGGGRMEGVGTGPQSCQPPEQPSKEQHLRPPCGGQTAPSQSPGSPGRPAPPRQSCRPWGPGATIISIEASALGAAGSVLTVWGSAQLRQHQQLQTRAPSPSPSLVPAVAPSPAGRAQAMHS